MYKREIISDHNSQGSFLPPRTRESSYAVRGTRSSAPPPLHSYSTQILRHRRHIVEQVHYGIPFRSCGHSRVPSWALRHVIMAEPSEVHSAYAGYVQMNAPEISANRSRPRRKD